MDFILEVGSDYTLTILGCQEKFYYFFICAADLIGDLVADLVAPTDHVIFSDTVVIDFLVFLEASSR